MRLEEEIVARLHKKSFEVFLVGGAVRDMLSDVPPKDFDYATNARPNDIIDIFSDKKISVVGKRFKVVMIGNVEVATYRKDVQIKLYSAKHCKPEFADTIEEDLCRRDLTINAMAINAVTNEFIDLHGGKKDLNEGIIKLVGNPVERLNQDPNRVVRACRFVAQGQRVFDPKTLEALIECSYYVDKYVDKERIMVEILKAMTLETPSMFFSALQTIGALQYIFPEMAKAFLHTGGKYHKETIGEHLMLAGDNVSPRFPLLRLAGYMHDIGKPEAYSREKDGSFKAHEAIGGNLTKKYLKKLHFSSKDTKEVSNLVYAHMRSCRGLSDKGIRRLRKYLSDCDVDPRSFIRLKLADRSANVGKSASERTPIRQLIINAGIRKTEENLPLTLKDLAIKGGDLIKEFKLKPGPIVGNLHNDLLNFVIEEGEEYNTYEILKEKSEILLNTTFKITMHDKYGDGSSHTVCITCGMCKDCRDCKCKDTKQMEE